MIIDELEDVSRLMSQSDISQLQDILNPNSRKNAQLQDTFEMTKRVVYRTIVGEYNQLQGPLHGDEFMTTYIYSIAME